MAPRTDDTPCIGREMSDPAVPNWGCAAGTTCELVRCGLCKLASLLLSCMGPLAHVGRLGQCARIPRSAAGIYIFKRTQPSSPCPIPCLLCSSLAGNATRLESSHRRATNISPAKRASAATPTSRRQVWQCCVHVAALAAIPSPHCPGQCPLFLPPHIRCSAIPSRAC